MTECMTPYALQPGHVPRAGDPLVAIEGMDGCDRRMSAKFAVGTFRQYDWLSV